MRMQAPHAAQALQAPAQAHLGKRHAVQHADRYVQHIPRAADIDGHFAAQQRAVAHHALHQLRGREHILIQLQGVERIHLLQKRRAYALHIAVNHLSSLHKPDRYLPQAASAVSSSAQMALCPARLKPPTLRCFTPLVSRTAYVCRSGAIQACAMAP